MFISVVSLFGKLFHNESSLPIAMKMILNRSSLLWEILGVTVKVSFLSCSFANPLVDQAGLSHLSLYWNGAVSALECCAGGHPWN